MNTTDTHRPLLARDDLGGSGPLVILLPGAGDLRSEHRYLAGDLSEAGYRVVVADLPGHGDSSVAESYGVAETADALLQLIHYLQSGPAAVVGCSFAPAAAVWAATEQPGSISRLVMISPHLEADHSIAGRILGWAMSALLRGPWMAGLWSRLYSSWYPLDPPADLDVETGKIRRMLADPDRRRAVRETLVADRDGMSERVDRLAIPSLVVFGSADSHFKDPASEAAGITARTGGTAVLIEGAGHYPHVERAAMVMPAILSFLRA